MDEQRQRGGEWSGVCFLYQSYHNHEQRSRGKDRRAEQRSAFGAEARECDAQRQYGGEERGRILVVSRPQWWDEHKWGRGEEKRREGSRGPFFEGDTSRRSVRCAIAVKL